MSQVGTRAVVRIVEPGLFVRCAHCTEWVKFIVRQKGKARQVIANVYEGNRWDRVEHFHEPCYDDAGQPYGVPADKKRARRSA